MTSTAVSIQSYVTLLSNDPNDVRGIVNTCRKLCALLAQESPGDDEKSTPPLSSALHPVTVFVSCGGLASTIALIKGWRSFYAEPSTGSALQALAQLLTTVFKLEPAHFHFALSCDLQGTLLDAIPSDFEIHGFRKWDELPFGVRHGVLQVLASVVEFQPSTFVKSSPPLPPLLVYALSTSSEYEQEWACKIMHAFLGHCLKKFRGSWSESDLGPSLGPAWSGVALSSLSMSLIRVINTGLPSAKISAASCVKLLVLGPDTASTSSAAVCEAIVAAGGTAALVAAVFSGSGNLQRLCVLCLAELIRQRATDVSELHACGALAHLARIFDTPVNEPTSPLFDSQSVASLLLWRVMDVSRGAGDGLEVGVVDAIEHALPNMCRIGLLGCDAALGAVSVACDIMPAAIMRTAFISTWLSRLLTSQVATLDTLSATCVCAHRLLVTEDVAAAAANEMIASAVPLALCSSIKRITEGFPSLSELSSQAAACLQVILTSVCILVNADPSVADSIASCSCVPTVFGFVADLLMTTHPRLVIEAVRWLTVMSTSPAACCDIIIHNGVPDLCKLWATYAETAAGVEDLLKTVVQQALEAGDVFLDSGALPVLVSVVHHHSSVIVKGARFDSSTSITSVLTALTSGAPAVKSVTSAAHANAVNVDSAPDMPLDEALSCSAALNILGNVLLGASSCDDVECLDASLVAALTVFLRLSVFPATEEALTRSHDSWMQLSHFAAIALAALVSCGCLKDVSDAVHDSHTISTLQTLLENWVPVTLPLPLEVDGSKSASLPFLDALLTCVAVIAKTTESLREAVHDAGLCSFVGTLLSEIAKDRVDVGFAETVSAAVSAVTASISGAVSSFQLSFVRNSTSTLKQYFDCPAIICHAIDTLGNMAYYMLFDEGGVALISEVWLDIVDDIALTLAGCEENGRVLGHCAAALARLDPVSVSTTLQRQNATFVLVSALSKQQFLPVQTRLDCVTLLHALSSRDGHAIVESGVLPVTVTILRVTTDGDEESTKLLDSVVELVHEIVVAENAASSVIVQADGVSVLCRLLIDCLEHRVSAPNRIVLLLSALVRIAMAESSSLPIMHASDVIPALIQVIALGWLPSDNEIPVRAGESSAWLLACLVEHVIDTTHAIGQYDGVPVLVSALGSASQTIADCGLLTLAAVLTHHPDLCPIAVSNDICPPLVRMLQSRSETTWLATAKVVGALCAASREARTVLREGSCLSVLSHIMNDPKTTLTITQLEVVTFAVRGLLSGGFVDVYPTEAGCFPSIVAGLVYVLQKASVGAQINASAALADLCIGRKRGMCNLIMDAGAVPVLTSVHNKTPSEPLRITVAGCLRRLNAVCPTDLRLRSEAVLGVLRSSSHNSDPFVDRSPTPVSPSRETVEQKIGKAVSGLKGHHDRVTKARAASVLADLIQHSYQLQSAAAELGAIPMLVDMLRSTNEDTLSSAAAATIALASCHPSNAEQFLAFGGADALMSHLVRHHVAVTSLRNPVADKDDGSPLQALAFIVNFEVDAQQRLCTAEFCAIIQWRLHNPDRTTTSLILQQRAAWLLLVMVKSASSASLLTICKYFNFDAIVDRVRNGLPGSEALLSMVLCHVASLLPSESAAVSPKSPSGSVSRLIRFDPRGSVITSALSHMYNSLLFSSDHAMKQECCLAITALAESGNLDANTIVATGAVSSITAALRYESPSSSEAAVVVLAHLCSLCPDVVDEAVAAGGCTGLAVLLQRLVNAAVLPPIAAYFASDCLVRMALARPRVVGNLVECGVVGGVSKLLERLLRARPGLGAYSPTFADVALENSRLITILLSAIGNLAANNPVAGPKGNVDWEEMFMQAEFALRACLPPPPPREISRKPVSKRAVVL